MQLDQAASPFFNKPSTPLRLTALLYRKAGSVGIENQSPATTKSATRGVGKGADTDNCL